MTYVQWPILALLISLKGFSQFNPKLLVGKWKLISGKNLDTTIIYQPSDQYYIQYFSNGTFKQTHKRNEEWKKGEWIKGTWYTVGKWKVTDSIVTMYDRHPVPPRKNLHYSDYTDTLVSLRGSELYILAQLNGGGEGVEGTMYYKKIK